MDAANGAFTADDNVDPVQRQGTGSTTTAIGEASVLAAEGGLDGKLAQVEESEETPLLGDNGSPRRRREGVEGGRNERDGLPWYKRPSVSFTRLREVACIELNQIYWLLGPFVLSAVAFGGIIVPKVNLILSLICREYFADRRLSDPDFTFLPIDFNEDNPQCRIPEVQARVSMFTLYGGLISGILSAIIAPKLGALSDRYGRKKIMLITTSGMLTGEIITIFAAEYPETFPVNFILLGYVFDGLCGSFIAAMALSHSYASDCTPPNRRNVVFAYFHGCLFTGIALGPLFAGYVVKWTGRIVSMFYVALGCHLFFIFFLLVVIPESLSKSRQLHAREKHRLSVEATGPAADWINQARSFNLFAPLKVLYPTGPGTSHAVRRNLLLLASVDTIIFGVAMGAMSCVILYVNYQFEWDTYYQSIFMSVVNICRVIILVVVLPGLTRIFRGPTPKPDSPEAARQNEGTDRFELMVIRAAIAFDALGFLGYTLARKGEVFMFAGAVTSFGGMGSPTLQAALTKHVRPDQIGQLLGAMGLLHAFAKVISPTVFNSIYAATVGKFTQTVFVILTAMFGIAELVAWFVRPGGEFLYFPS